MIAETMVGLALLSCPVDNDERPVCEAFEGTAVVTFMYHDEITCDVVPPQQLNIVFDASYVPAWGGDASVAQAAQECDFMGGRQVWVSDPYRLICEDVDY